MTTYDEARTALTAAPVQHDELDLLLEGIDARHSILSQQLVTCQRAALEAELALREVAARLWTLDAARSALVRDSAPPAPYVNPTPQPEPVQAQGVPVDTADQDSEPDSAGEGMQVAQADGHAEATEVEDPALGRTQTHHARILAYVAAHPGQTVNEISEGLGIDHKTVSVRTSAMYRQGVIERDDSSMPYLYFLAGRKPSAEPVATDSVVPTAGTYVSLPAILEHFGEGIELSAEEAIELIGCTRADLRALVNSGQLQCVKRSWNEPRLYSRPTAAQVAQ